MKLTREPCLRLPVKWSRRAAIMSDLLPKGSVCIEVGVCQGDSAHDFLTIVSPSRLVLIDAWNIGVYADDSYNKRFRSQEKLNKDRAILLRRFPQYFLTGAVKSLNCFEPHEAEPPEDYFKVTPNNGRVDIFHCTSKAAAQFLPDDYFDWAHIDANHVYEEALQDFRNYAPKLKMNGYMLCHDFAPVNDYGVDEAVMQFTMESPEFVTLGISAEEYYPTAVLQRQPLED